MAKRNLLGDTVIRRDGMGMLWLMNRLEGGWRSDMYPVESEAQLLGEFNVRLGEWTRDECSEYCPVTRIPRSEQPTLHDGDEPEEPFRFHDVGQRGQVPVGDSIIESIRSLLQEQHDFGPRGPSALGVTRFQGTTNKPAVPDKPLVFESPPEWKEAMARRKL